MKALLRRIALFTLVPLGLLLLIALSLLGWARFESGDDLLAKLPDGCDVTMRVRSLPELAEILESSLKQDLHAFRDDGWLGHFGGAAIGRRGKSLVVIIECPRLVQFLPMDVLLAEKLNLRKCPGGHYERHGLKIWMASRGNLAYIATEESILRNALASAERSRSLPADAPLFEIHEGKIVRRLDRQQVLAELANESRNDLLAHLPASCEATIRLTSVPECADLLADATGLDARLVSQGEPVGKFGGAAAGLRGRGVVVVIELPRFSQYFPIEDLISQFSTLQRNPDGSYNLGGTTVWIARRGYLAWLATSEALLRESVAISVAQRRIPDGAPAVELRDAGLYDRLNLQAAEHKLGDVEARIWDKLRGALSPQGVATGRVTGGVLELTASRDYTLRPEHVALRAVASRPPALSRLSGVSIPGLVLQQIDPFPAQELWHEIVYDPSNGRLVEAFQREIRQYEKLVGRDFETELLPGLGPERAFLVARPDWKKFAIRPKTKFPVVMFGIECRGIEEEVLKSLEKFLTEAEREGKRIDLPAPRGRTIPVLDPFSHDRVELRGQKIVRVTFREGVSQFGPEVAPGYAVIDGVLWLSSYWPMFGSLTTGSPRPPPAHSRGRLDGAAARLLALDAADDIAEMGASASLLARVQPQAEQDFEKLYGRTGRWTMAMMKPFTRLETELRLERPDLRGQDFDKELESRIDSWIASEKRSMTQHRADPLKKEPAFVQEVASRKNSITGIVALFARLDSIEWWCETSPRGLDWTVRVNFGGK